MLFASCCQFPPAENVVVVSVTLCGAPVDCGDFDDADDRVDAVASDAPALAAANQEELMVVDPIEDDYDPRKPEYIIQAEPEEVEKKNAALLQQQMEKLELALVKRSVKRRNSRVKVAEHYASVIDEMRNTAAGALSIQGVLETAQSFDMGDQPSLHRAEPLQEASIRRNSEPVDFEPTCEDEPPLRPQVEQEQPQTPSPSSVMSHTDSAYRKATFSTISTSTDLSDCPPPDVVIDGSLAAEQKLRRMTRTSTFESSSCHDIESVLFGMPVSESGDYSPL